MYYTYPYIIICAHIDSNSANGNRSTWLVGEGENTIQLQDSAIIIKYVRKIIKTLLCAAPVVRRVKHFDWLGTGTFLFAGFHRSVFGQMPRVIVRPIHDTADIYVCVCTIIYYRYYCRRYCRSGTHAAAAAASTIKPLRSQEVCRILFYLEVFFCCFFFQRLPYCR